MEKRFVCFTCYKFHPEMKGVSEEEFNTGENCCKQEKCAHKGEKLEAAEYCELCDMLFLFGAHKHKD